MKALYFTLGLICTTINNAIAISYYGETITSSNNYSIINNKDSELKTKSSSKIIDGNVLEEGSEANTTFTQLLTLNNSTLRVLTEGMKNAFDTLLETNREETAKLQNKVAELELKIDDSKNKILNAKNEILDEIYHLKEKVDTILKEQNTEFEQIRQDMETGEDEALNSKNQILAEIHNLKDYLETINMQNQCNGERIGEMSGLTNIKNNNVIISKATKKGVVKSEKLANYLNRVTGSKTISGLYMGYTGENRKKGIQNILKSAGVFPGILTTHMPKYSDDVSQWESYMNEVISHWNNGFLVHITWWMPHIHPLLHTNFESTKNVTADEIKWNDLIKDGGNLNAEWKKHMDFLAVHLRKLQTSGVVAICDILPHMNEKHYLWRGRPGLNGSVKLFQITQDYLKKHHGLHSLLWTWSLSMSGDMNHFEKYWPGNNYVDVTSVYLMYRKDVSILTYQKLLDVVWDKPLSMENVFSVPTSQLLMEQPRWTWFTAMDLHLKNSRYNNDENVKNTFRSNSVIHKGNVEFFNIST